MCVLLLLTFLPKMGRYLLSFTGVKAKSPMYYVAWFIGPWSDLHQETKYVSLDTPRLRCTKLCNFGQCSHFELSARGRAVCSCIYRFTSVPLVFPLDYSFFILWICYWHDCYCLLEPSWIIMKNYWILLKNWRLLVLRQWSRERWLKILQFWFMDLSKWISFFLTSAYSHLNNLVLQISWKV